MLILVRRTQGGGKSSSFLQISVNVDIDVLRREQLIMIHTTNEAGSSESLDLFFFFLPVFRS